MTGSPWCSEDTAVSGRVPLQESADFGVDIGDSTSLDSSSGFEAFFPDTWSGLEAGWGFAGFINRKLLPWQCRMAMITSEVEKVVATVPCMVWYHSKQRLQEEK